MNCISSTRWAAAAGLLAVLLLATGCRCHGCHGCGHGCHAGLGLHRDYPIPQPPPYLGYSIEPFFKIQESHGEASDFVIYEHEFQRDRLRLNSAGEDHVTQIAVRLNEGANYPVVVERNHSSIKEGTEFEYPVNEDPQLDNRRRELIVEALTAMGVPDADRRVVVAPELTEGFEDFQAERVYQQFGFSGFGFGGLGTGGFGGFGGFGGGFGGFGGGFGGGFF